MKIDDKFLNQPCFPVVNVECPEIKNLIADMLEMCWIRRKTPQRPHRPDEQIAVGLAANQVGFNVRVIVVDYGGFKGGMINPEILRYTGGTTKAKEQCLSFGKKAAYVERYKIVKVRWQESNGDMCQRKFRGLLARIIQHEVDHLNGITMLEREKYGAPSTGLKL